MNRAMKRTSAVLALGVVTALAIAPAEPARAAAGPLVGTFAIAPGTCASTVSGSYFRMILPTGDANGPFAGNGDSECADQTYTPLSPGTDAGLITGTQQPAPNPAFDSAGNGLASRITRPTPFYGVHFAVSTEAVDPQTGTTTPAPVIAVDANGALSGTLPSFGASWNKQTFNQGSPKPDGSYPGNSSRLAGTFDAATGAFTLTWRSQIEGGPFDNFTGVWHLEGTFDPAGDEPTAATTAPTAETTPGAAGGSGSVPVGHEGGATAITAGPVASDEVGAAPEAGDSAVATETLSTEVSTSSEGWQPARWLVLLIATAGLAGAVGLVWLSRTEPDVSG